MPYKERTAAARVLSPGERHTLNIVAEFFFYIYIFLIKAFLTFTYKIEIKKEKHTHAHTHTHTHTHTYIVQTKEYKANQSYFSNTVT